MISFLVSISLLILGYFVYGNMIEKIMGIDENRTTPAIRQRDNIDYLPLPVWKSFLIQFLNIAGLGPIFGAIAGAMYGPSAFLWIVFGCIFGGAVHDYFSGMLSLKHNGLSISEVVGLYLGSYAKHFMRFFTVILLIFVGSVFLIGPAKIIDGMTNHTFGITIWVFIILFYYILSTLLPIDKLISKLYPIFGGAMLFMALGIFIMLLTGDYNIPELTPNNLINMKSNANETPIFPMLFITIACGAISGFHATQSPLMARCIKNEADGKKVFFGSMITEGIVALIWAAAAMVFFKDVNGLNEAMVENGNSAAWAANEISLNMLGKVGGILAILGIVAAPITSGDTAFRSARLILADTFKYDQKTLLKRLYISIPLFIISFGITKIDFAIIWRYFAWSNQTLSVIILWTITAFLFMKNKNFWVTLLPAIFMTMVCTTYILVAPEGFGLGEKSYTTGAILTTLITISFFLFQKKKKN